MAAAAPVLTGLFTEAATAAATDRLMSSFSSAMSAAKGEDSGDYGLAGKVPKQFTAALKLANPALYAFGKALKPISSFAKALEDWGGSLLASRKHLMAFNGVIAGTVLEAERRSMVRKMGEGRRTSGSTQFMSEQLNELSDQIQPFKDAMTNGFNLLAGSVIKQSTLALQVLLTINQHGRNINNIVDLINNALGMGSQQNQMTRFIDNVRRGFLDRDEEADRELMGGPPPEQRIDFRRR